MGPVGVQEMVVIFLVALVLFGPKKLPELGRTIGKAITEFRRAQSELKATFEHHMKELEKESESVKEVTKSYTTDLYGPYDSHAYDSHQYDAGVYGAGSYDYNSEPAESSPTTVGASATQGAESPASPEATVNGTVARTNSSEAGATQSPEMLQIAEHHPEGKPPEHDSKLQPNGHPSPESVS